MTDSQPEQAVMYAILARAVCDAFGTGGPHGMEIRQARLWLLSGGDWFRQVCEFCDVDPGSMRAWCRKQAEDGWPKERLAKIKERTRTDYQVWPPEDVA